MPPCIFDILAGSAPADFVHQDHLCVAFMDIRPINPGHVLVVPRQHAAQLTELAPQSVGHILQVAQRVDAALRTSGIQCDGVNLFLADGRPAGQEVMHVHLHVIPRFTGDGHHLRFSPAYYVPTPSTQLSKNAGLIHERM
jgi:diadenosine tetraphosphate (Ap4A) HIT family hydrolase